MARHEDREVKLEMRTQICHPYDKVKRGFLKKKAIP
jgi:hypothetical protein